MKKQSTKEWLQAFLAVGIFFILWISFVNIFNL